MRRVVLVMLLFALASLAGAGTCGGGGGQKGVGEPCTRRAECAEPLECLGGVCREPAIDAATTDAG